MSNLAELGTMPKSIDDIHDYLASGIETGEFTPVKEELEHHFADGLYGRRCKVKAGTLFTTKVHKKEHISVCLSGKILVMDEAGDRVEITSTKVFVTPAGTHRIIYVLEDVDYLTVHAYAAEPDINMVTQELVCDSRNQYNKLLGEV